MPASNLRLATLAVLAITVGSAAAQVKAQGPSGPAAILARAAKVSGGPAWKRVRDIETSGRVRGPQGDRGVADSFEDSRRGRYLSRTRVDGETADEGFDGRRVWSRDASGYVRVEGETSLARARSLAYRTRRAYFGPPAPGETRALLAPLSEAGRGFDIVRITPAGGTSFDLWFDRASGLLDRMVEPTGFATFTTHYADYRRTGGVLLPFVSVTSTAADARFDETFQADRITVNGGLPARAFDPPPPPPPDYAFPAGVDRVEIPFRLLNNHIYVDVAINGAPPRPMMFDTGATDLLAFDAAAASGLTPRGQVAVTGDGEAIRTGGRLTAPTLTLGGVTFANLPFTAMDYGEQRRVEGVADAAGVLGYEIPKRLVTRIDYGRRIITLSKPGAAPPRGAIALPFEFLSQLVVVRASLDGHPGRFAIDTGSRASVLLLPGFARATGLDRSLATRERLFGWGIGGPVRAKVGRAHALDLGGVTVVDPVVGLTPGGPPVDGNIGGAILRRFTITLDYGRQSLWLSPNETLTSPDPMDLSGVWMNLDADGFLVVAVERGSAGEAAGLKPGDRVTAVDGTPSARIGLSELRERLKQPGAVARLGLQRPGGEREIALRTADATPP